MTAPLWLSIRYFAQRAGFSIDWAATDKANDLTALTKEIDTTGETDVTRLRLLMPATYVRKSAKRYKGVRREKA